MEIVGAIGGVGAAAGAISGAVVGINRIGRRLHDVHTALVGEPERVVAGVTLPATPGIGERLARVEAQVYPNHGESMFDAVRRIENAVAVHVAAPISQAHPAGVTP